jgi:carbon-monoxide dehydrogenase large subunit
MFGCSTATVQYSPME